MKKKTQREISGLGRLPIDPAIKKERVVLYIRRDVIEGWGEAELKAYLVKIAETTKPRKK